MRKGSAFPKGYTFIQSLFLRTRVSKSISYVDFDACEKVVVPRGSKYPILEAPGAQKPTFHGIWDQSPSIFGCTLGGIINLYIYTHIYIYIYRYTYLYIILYYTIP